GVAAADFLELALGIHRGHIYGKIGHSHLRFEDLLQAVSPQEFRAKAVKLKFVVFCIERREERDPLDVIPMIMSNKNVRFRGAAGARESLAISQHAQTGP